MISPILNLCARIKPHSKQQELLQRAFNENPDWEDLLFSAEKHGMAPLLHKHIPGHLAHAPDTFIRGLRFLCLRHQQANLLLMESLSLILTIFEQHGIPCLILKGAALCHTLYPEIDLRPMRDLDILLSKENCHKAHQLLQNHGYSCSREKAPRDYYHLPPLLKVINGMQVCVELHHGLFPNDPPYCQQLAYEDLNKKAILFEINGIPAQTLGPEDMLYHLYQHGFHAPLTYEPYKLISVADIVGLVEDKIDDLDWDRIQQHYPQVWQALPLFHYLTPLTDNVLNRIPNPPKSQPRCVGKPYSGWPRIKFMKKQRNFWLLLHDTFISGQWWLMLYYGSNGLFSSIWCRAVLHPLHLLRWVKIYGRSFLRRRR